MIHSFYDENQLPHKATEPDYSFMCSDALFMIEVAAKRLPDNAPLKEIAQNYATASYIDEDLEAKVDNVRETLSSVIDEFQEVEDDLSIVSDKEFDLTINCEMRLGTSYDKLHQDTLSSHNTVLDIIHHNKPSKDPVGVLNREFKELSELRQDYHKRNVQAILSLPETPLNINNLERAIDTYMSAVEKLYAERPNKPAKKPQATRPETAEHN